jgi:hypothetical protein
VPAALAKAEADNFGCFLDTIAATKEKKKNFPSARGNRLLAQDAFPRREFFIKFPFSITTRVSQLQQLEHFSSVVSQELGKI